MIKTGLPQYITQKIKINKLCIKYISNIYYKQRTIKQEIPVPEGPEVPCIYTVLLCKYKTQITKLREKLISCRQTEKKLIFSSVKTISQEQSSISSDQTTNCYLH